MYIPQQSVTSWKGWFSPSILRKWNAVADIGLPVVITCFHLVTLTASAWRLWFRYHRRRLWVDDYIIIPALILYVVNIVVMWILFAKRREYASIIVLGNAD